MAHRETMAPASPTHAHDTPTTHFTTRRGHVPRCARLVPKAVLPLPDERRHARPRRADRAARRSGAPGGAGGGGRERRRDERGAVCGDAAVHGTHHLLGRLPGQTPPRHFADTSQTLPRRLPGRLLQAGLGTESSGHLGVISGHLGVISGLSRAYLGLVSGSSPLRSTSARRAQSSAAQRFGR